MKKKISSVFTQITEENIIEAYKEAEICAANEKRYCWACYISTLLGYAAFSLVVMTAVFGYIFRNQPAVLEQTPFFSVLWRTMDVLTARITFGVDFVLLRWLVQALFTLPICFIFTVFPRKLLACILPKKICEIEIPADRIEQAKKLAQMELSKFNRRFNFEFAMLFVFPSLIACGTFYFDFIAKNHNFEFKSILIGIAIGIVAFFCSMSYLCGLMYRVIFLADVELLIRTPMIIG